MTQTWRTVAGRHTLVPSEKGMVPEDELMLKKMMMKVVREGVELNGAPPSVLEEHILV